MNPSPSLRQEAFVVKEILSAETNRKSREAAVECGKTYAIAAAITAGVPIRPDGFERVIDGFEPSKTTVTFAIENKDEVVFEAFAGETTDTPTLMKRLQDEAWILENPTHPIAYMYFALRNYAALVKAIREHKALVQFRRHRSKAFCVLGGDRQKNAFILDRAGFSTAEIDDILNTLPA